MPYEMSYVAYIIFIVYLIILLTAIFGNSFFITAIFKNRKLHSAVFIFLANESLSDLIFATLSLFIGVEYMISDWVFTETFCRLLGAFIETCFTVSILTLSAVATERYFSVCQLNKTRKTIAWCVRVIGCLWIFSLLVCSPLFYAYTTKVRTNLNTERGSNTTVSRTVDNVTVGDELTYECGTYYWTNTAGIVYFSVHGALIYLFPIGIMFFTHLKIAAALRRTNRPMSGMSSATMSQNCDAMSDVSGKNSETNAKLNLEDIQNSNGGYSAAVLQREADKAQKSKAKKIKIINLLLAITITFIVLWTPFIVTRIVSKTMFVNNMVWSIIQVLVLLSTTTNFFITLKMSPEFKKTIISFFPCVLTKASEPVAYVAPVSATTTTSTRSAIYQDMSTEI